MLGMALAGSLVCIDIACTNMAVSMLNLPLQQTIGAPAPAWTVLIESLYRRRLQYPLVYMVIAVLCAGPMLVALDPYQERRDAKHADTKLIGCLLMLCSRLSPPPASTSSQSRSSRRRRRSSARSPFSFGSTSSSCASSWWSLLNGELVALFHFPQNGGMWVVLVLTATLGGVRALSQFVVLRLV
tara:strand:+ start:736 stop:1290 length:555 start_codon:yes stop_codon:yes gene_type:complete